MNPIFQWIIEHAKAEALARRCPRCRRRQIVPEAKAKETVRCEKCGADIPPGRK
jgi:ribosomal protein S27E